MQSPSRDLDPNTVFNKSNYFFQICGASCTLISYSANSRPWQDRKCCSPEGSEEGAWGGRKRREASLMVWCVSPWNTLEQDSGDTGFIPPLLLVVGA